MTVLDNLQKESPLEFSKPICATELKKWVKDHTSLSRLLENIREVSSRKIKHKMSVDQRLNTAWDWLVQYKLHKIIEVNTLAQLVKVSLAVAEKYYMSDTTNGDNQLLAKAPELQALKSAFEYAKKEIYDPDRKNMEWFNEVMSVATLDVKKKQQNASHTEISKTLTKDFSRESIDSSDLLSSPEKYHRSYSCSPSKDWPRTNSSRVTSTKEEQLCFTPNGVNKYPWGETHHLSKKINLQEDRITVPMKYKMSVEVPSPSRNAKHPSACTTPVAGEDPTTMPEISSLDLGSNLIQSDSFITSGGGAVKKAHVNEDKLLRSNGNAEENLTRPGESFFLESEMIHHAPTRSRAPIAQNDEKNCTSTKKCSDAEQIGKRDSHENLEQSAGMCCNQTPRVNADLETTPSGPLADNNQQTLNLEEYAFSLTDTKVEPSSEKSTSCSRWTGLHNRKNTDQILFDGDDIAREDTVSVHSDGTDQYSEPSRSAWAPMENNAIKMLELKPQSDVIPRKLALHWYLEQEQEDDQIAHIRKLMMKFRLAKSIVNLNESSGTGQTMDSIESEIDIMKVEEKGQDTTIKDTNAISEIYLSSLQETLRDQLSPEIFEEVSISLKAMNEAFFGMANTNAAIQRHLQSSQKVSFDQAQIINDLNKKIATIKENSEKWKKELSDFRDTCSIKFMENERKMRELEERKVAMKLELDEKEQNLHNLSHQLANDKLTARKLQKTLEKEYQELKEAYAHEKAALIERVSTEMHRLRTINML